MTGQASRYSRQLQQRQNDGLWRRRRLLESAQGPEVRLDGNSYIAFCSNDYLGLANHPEVVAAAAGALQSCGLGGGASHLVNGHHQQHHLLEQELAEFCGRDAALLFSTGYMANMAVISTLIRRGDWILQDKLNHASLIDGGQLSAAAGARFQRYLHNDPHSLESWLQKYQSHKLSNPESHCMAATDGVFSMDGNLAQLPRLSQLCQQHEAVLFVDDAHGLGCLGEQGGGTLEHYGLTQEQVPLLVGTLGKAFGTAGAFVAGPAELIELLVQLGRPYIYTTAMPPAIAAATRKSLQLVRQGGELRGHLHDLIAYFRQHAQALGYQLMPSKTAIQPIMLGDARQALALAEFLESKGILAVAIRPPTVPAGSSRIRITLSAAHSFAQLDRLLEALRQAWQAGLAGESS